MLTAAQFQAIFPEFAQADPTVVATQLAYAYTKTPTFIWGALQDEGAGLRCAQALALSPFARAMKLINKDGSTFYDSRLNDLIAMVAGGGTAAIGQGNNTLPPYINPWYIP